MPDIANIDAWLAQREATVPALRPGCAKRIRWYGPVETRSDWVVVYIHGFSATAEEIRPLPDMVADGLAANLYFARLTGHGQDGAAMGTATLAAWQTDVAETLEIARTLGDRVLVIGCSTGCTLATLALVGGADLAGVVFVSPNFGLRHRLGQFLLGLPGVRHWGHLIAGRERSFPVLNEAHGKYWTTQYPITAAYPMGEAVAAVRRANLSRIAAPAFLAINPEDQVISPEAAAQVAQRWGGAVTQVALEQGPEDDPMGHVMAGDIFSPKQTAPLAEKILGWARAI